MTTYDLHKLLEKIGFSAKEAAVYLAGLELGPSLASSIAKKAKINRGTAYNILEKLTSYGLLTEITQNKFKFYSSENPLHIIRYLKNKKQRLENNLIEMQKRIDEFKNLKIGIAARPRIKLFTDSQSIKNIYEKIRSSKNPALLMKPSEFSEIIVSGGQTFIISQKERLSIIIESPEIAKMHKTIFKFIPSKLRYKKFKKTTD